MRNIHAQHEIDHCPWLQDESSTQIILASASPRRVELLRQIGVQFVQVVADVDECWPDDSSPTEAVCIIAARKARAIAKDWSDSIIIGADTSVFVDGDPLGKPVDDADAMRMLRRLTGKTHEVVTGLAFIDTRRSQALEITDVVTTEVTMRSASEDELRSYVNTGEPADKAGAYGIQGCGAGLVTRISGCYFNVVGLPISVTIHNLRKLLLR
jgi:nucleoside triphosphate pyrophosphatase